MRTLNTLLICLLPIAAFFAFGCWEFRYSYTKDDIDGGGDSDTDTDADTFLDAGTDAGCSGHGVWYDTKNDRCWQDPPSDTPGNWYVAAGVEHATYNPADGGVEDYCSAMGSGWRLPTISELRSLFRSGTDTECNRLEWDLRWIQVPDGYCGVLDNCLDFECLVTYSPCNTGTCGLLGGPGVEECYWNEALRGECTLYWSSSEYTDTPDKAWCINFDSGRILPNDMESSHYTRCIRDEP